MFVRAGLRCCPDTVHMQEGQLCWESPATSAASAVSTEDLGSKASQSDFQDETSELGPGHICNGVQFSRYLLCV